MSGKHPKYIKALNEAEIYKMEKEQERIEKRTKFRDIESGEWVQPIRKGYLFKCCDCGLVHSLDFRLVKNKRGSFIQFRAKRI